MQKKFLLTLTVITVGLASQAQIEKGDLLLGGSLGFNSNTTSVSNVSTTGSNSNLSPELGLAIGKNSVLGLRGGFYYSPLKDAAGNKQTYFEMTAGAFWKRFFPINEKIGWFTDLEMAYSYSENKSTYPA